MGPKEKERDDHKFKINMGVGALMVGVWYAIFQICQYAHMHTQID